MLLQVISAIIVILYLALGYTQKFPNFADVCYFCDYVYTFP